MWKLLLTFGIRGDYNICRRLAKKYTIFKVLHKLYESFHGAFLPLNNEIEGDIMFPHSTYGCFFSTTCKIGRNCTIMQHVTIGSNFFGGGEIK